MNVIINIDKIIIKYYLKLFLIDVGDSHIIDLEAVYIRTYIGSYF